jgi:primase-polymerase (primpol)-like protein
MKLNLDCLPEELRQRPQWVVHKDKVPYIAGGDGRASSTDSLTWRSFEEAV